MCVQHPLVFVVTVRKERSHDMNKQETDNSQNIVYTKISSFLFEDFFWIGFLSHWFSLDVKCDMCFETLILFLAHLSRRLTGELIG